MRVFDLPPEFTVQAKRVLFFEGAAQSVIRELINEIVKNQIAVGSFWRSVATEARKMGIDLQDDEVFVFDYMTERFTIVKRTDNQGARVT